MTLRENLPDIQIIKQRDLPRGDRLRDRDMRDPDGNPVDLGGQGEFDPPGGQLQ